MALKKDCVADYIAAFVAVMVTLMVAFVTVMVMIRPVPEQNEQLIGQIQGALFTAMVGIIGFFYSTNKSSRDKDETIATSVQAIHTAQQQPAANTGPTIPIADGQTLTVEGTGDAGQTP